jgi:hypothetical protein
MEPTLRAHQKSFERVVSRMVRYREALQRIAGLPKTHDGDTDEQEWDDSEGAFNNGVDVGTFEGFELASKIAKEALKRGY